MNLGIELLDLFCMICGVVIVYKSAPHIEMMRWRSNHIIRFAYWSLCVGGASMFCSGFSNEPWLRTIGWSMVVAGTALLSMFDKRRPVGIEYDEQRRDATTVMRSGGHGPEGQQ